MNYHGNNDWRDYHLSHHGILGQKWGKKNGPPYPLSGNAHSSSENKAGWKKSLGGGRNESLYGRQKEKKIVDKEISDEKFREDVFKKNPNVAMLSPDVLNWAKKHKKEIAIGVGVVGVAAGAAFVAYKIQNGDFNEVAKVVDSVTKVGVDKPNTIDSVTKASIDKAKDFVEKHIDDIDVTENLGGFSSKSERYLAAWFNQDAHRLDMISEEAFQHMDNATISLNMGTELYRMSKNPHDTLREGIEYVSFGSDRDRYKAFLPKIWKVNGRNVDNVAEAVLEAKERIKAPGQKDAIKFMEQAYKEMFPGNSDEAIHEHVLQTFYRQSLNWVKRGDPINERFFEILKKEGYNAVVDYNDAGRLANKPLILLNGSKQATVKMVNKVTTKESNDLFDNIDLPDKLRGFTIDDYNKTPNKFAYDAAFQMFLKK